MSATLTVFTLYRDTVAATDWLVRAFGFEVVNRWGPTDDEIEHAELRLGEAIVLVQRAAAGQPPAPLTGTSTSRAPVLCLDDEAAVDELYRRVVAAGGATVVIEPETTQWGNHRFEVLDPEGHQWSVGSYRPGQVWA